MIKKLNPMEAVEALPISGKRAALSLEKVIKSAIANAKEKGFAESDLIFDEIQINEGPRLKRGRPVSKGRWHPYKRRMSHIRVVLKTKDKKSEVVSKNKSATKITKGKLLKKTKLSKKTNENTKNKKGEKAKKAK